ncbi:Protein AIM2 [Mycena indigotica]|uniref:Protein AIM2 n=1 Tax=Mycena indigotica TaxID=2126181 RepID=A0A8H6SHD6_9AGAR|nr:Protein AIM2 [Mycena indigotica]KAF7298830.1 Protein AIM2 [Mycena indigotica]
MLPIVLLSVLSAVYAAVVPQLGFESHLPSQVAAGVQPLGKNVTINGVLTYVTLPKKKFDPKIAVLLLTDVFGLPSPDNLVLADQWAAAGFATFAPDYLNGDALPPDGLGNITAWAVNHGEAQTTPPLLAVVNALKSRGVKQIAVTGYCFGGLYTVRLVQNNTVTVGTTAHPSSLDVPIDFEVVKAQSHVPIEINNAELDTGFTPALAVETDSVLDDGQYPPGYLRRQFNGVGHGFAVRANASDPVQVAAKNGAFDTSLAFIKKHLK